MKLELAKDHRIRYSPRERSVFSALPKSGHKISTEELAEIVFKDDDRFNKRTLIVCALRSLRNKILHNREPFVLQTSGHKGPHCMMVWLEKK